MSSSPLLVICGPTGSGKSALATRLARALHGEIINYDSVQVYRGLDVGSAKTPLGDREGVPHHLLDVIEPTQELTAGAYARLARQCLAEITDRGRLPILVGGTGFYLRSLLLGLPPLPGRNPELRLRLEGLRIRRPAALHRYLRRADAPAARRIHPNDHQKLIRAIEVAGAEKAGKGEPLSGFQVLKLGLAPERAGLSRALDVRSAEFLDTGGLLRETEVLLKAGVPADAKCLQTLGYRQAVKLLQGEMTVEAAKADLQVRTRQYAKRQMTWFRREPDVHWLYGFGADPEIQRTALEHVTANSGRSSAVID